MFGGRERFLTVAILLSGLGSSSWDIGRRGRTKLKAKSLSIECGAGGIVGYKGVQDHIAGAI